jgi:hypothetical protein
MTRFRTPDVASDTACLARGGRHHRNPEVDDAALGIPLDGRPEGSDLGLALLTLTTE